MIGTITDSDIKAANLKPVRLKSNHFMRWYKGWEQSNKQIDRLKKKGYTIEQIVQGRMLSYMK